MANEQGGPAPPYYANVVSGEAVQKLVASGYRSEGISHKFGMTWPCGHTADAIEVSDPDRVNGSKVCATCAQKYGLK